MTDVKEAARTRSFLRLSILRTDAVVVFCWMIKSARGQCCMTYMQCCRLYQFEASSGIDPKEAAVVKVSSNFQLQDHALARFHHCVMHVKKKEY